MISKRPIFGSGKVPFTLFLRQRRGEGQLLITSQLCCYLKKKDYSLKFGEKITFYHFSKKMPIQRFSPY